MIHLHIDVTDLKDLLKEENGNIKVELTAKLKELINRQFLSHLKNIKETYITKIIKEEVYEALKDNLMLRNRIRSAITEMIPDPYSTINLQIYNLIDKHKSELKEKIKSSIESFDSDYFVKSYLKEKIVQSLK